MEPTLGSVVQIYPLQPKQRGKWIDDGVVVEIVPRQTEALTNTSFRGVDCQTRYVVRCRTRTVLRTAAQMGIIAP